MLILRRVLLVVTIAALGLSASPGSAAEPGWTPRMLKVGADRARTNATDILDRPYRPGHFYGNTVRRAHYRGSPLPTAGDMFTTVRVLVTRQSPSR